MCAMSMVMDSMIVDWRKLSIDEYPLTETSIDKFRRDLNRARQVDIDNGEPDCELDEKREALLTLAKQLGVEIDFL